MAYDKWDGNKPVKSLTDLHLLHTIRALMENRITFKVYFDIPSMMSDEADIPDNADLPPFQAMAPEQAEKERANWLIVLQAEALQRGLDWSKPPTRRVGLVDFLEEKAEQQGYEANATKSLFNYLRVVLKDYAIPQPEIDVYNLNGQPTYMHWKVGTGKGKGTPIVDTF